MLDKPFRMSVTDFFKGGIGSSGGVSVAGSIDCGHVQVGEQVLVMPGAEIGVVKGKNSHQWMEERNIIITNMDSAFQQCKLTMNQLPGVLLATLF